MRLDRPAGFWAFFWNYFVGLSLGLNFPSAKPPPSILEVALLVLYLLVWAAIFRGIVCTWNDILDQDFDRKVARTRFRPIARGAISTAQAYIFTLGQVAVGAMLLTPFPRGAHAHALVEGALLFIYPLLKRVTDFPQVVLAFAISEGLFFSCAILGREPLMPLLNEIGIIGDANIDKVVRMPLASSHFYAMALVYLALVLWTVIFDTVYAHQDYTDDKKAGVHGLAVLLGRKGTKPAFLVLALLQVACLVAAGKSAGFGWTYFTLSCIGTGGCLMFMIGNVRLEEGSSCAWWFGPGSRLVGTAISSGLLAEFIANRHPLAFML